MEPISEHPRINAALGSPQGADSISPLPVESTDWGYISYWKPSWKELFSLMAGRAVRLCVLSKAHPPVWLDVETEEQ